MFIWRKFVIFYTSCLVKTTMLYCLQNGSRRCGTAGQTLLPLRVRVLECGEVTGDRENKEEWTHEFQRSRDQITFRNYDRDRLIMDSIASKLTSEENALRNRIINAIVDTHQPYSPSEGEKEMVATL